MINRNYLILALLMLALAAGLLFLPQRKGYRQVNPDALMWEIVQPTRYLSTDEVARRIIEGDPTIELIDVRDTAQFAQFSLVKAINIPFDSLLSDAYGGYLGIEDMDVVFYGNDDIKADEAWVIARRMGYGSIYVMRGGLNSWMSTIIRPEAPPETATLKEMELYDFRRGASAYFTGASIQTTVKKIPVKLVKRKKAKVVAGGC